MAKVMLINVTHAEESRVAIVADGTLVSFEIESFNREHLKGNIYKGVVQRVHPALEAAFVDIGAERDAFLPLDEICFRNLPHPVRASGNGERRRPRIQDVVKPGDELLVQIVKEQFGSKPPTLTTFFSLPGRFLVLLPGSDEAGISRRIEGADRVRVRELVEKLQPPEGFGIIVRTVVGFDPGLADLQRDLTYLLRLWERIQQVAQSKRAPALVYREHDLVLRNIRDYFTPDIDEIYVDNEEVFERARQFLRDVLPEKEHALRLYQGDKPIFSQFNIESQIESIYKRRVPLKSGGYIVIDGTEALTAIDVNSGRATRGANQEETAFRTNLEAAVEIARQLRLRDVGGLIVIDFIDMRNPQHISEVEKALRTAMFEDKARHEVGRISHFGLLEVSRQRLRPAATATTYVTCRMCDGYGLVRTTESAALVALRKAHNRVAQGDVGSLKVSLPTDVAMYLLNQKREDLAQLERRYGVKILVQTREDLMPHQCEIEVKARTETAASEVTPLLRLGGVAAPAAAVSPAKGEAAVEQEVTNAASPPESEPATSGAENVAAGSGQEAPERTARKRRRRGRRRGRGRLAAESLQVMVQTLAAHVPGLAERGSSGAPDAFPCEAERTVSTDASVLIHAAQSPVTSGAAVQEESFVPMTVSVVSGAGATPHSEAIVIESSPQAAAERRTESDTGFARAGGETGVSLEPGFSDQRAEEAGGAPGPSEPEHGVRASEEPAGGEEAGAQAGEVVSAPAREAGEKVPARSRRARAGRGGVRGTGEEKPAKSQGAARKQQGGGGSRQTRTKASAEQKKKKATATRRSRATAAKKRSSKTARSGAPDGGLPDSES